MHGLEELKSVSWRNGSKYALFDRWFTLGELARSASRGSSADILAAVRDERDRLAELSIWK
jgi:hypothetical protein